MEEAEKEPRPTAIQIFAQIKLGFGGAGAVQGKPTSGSNRMFGLKMSERDGIAPSGVEGQASHHATRSAEEAADDFLEHFDRPVADEPASAQGEPENSGEEAVDGLLAPPGLSDNIETAPKEEPTADDLAAVQAVKEQLIKLGLHKEAAMLDLPPPASNDAEHDHDRAFRVPSADTAVAGGAIGGDYAEPTNEEEEAEEEDDDPGYAKVHAEQLPVWEQFQGQTQSSLGSSLRQLLASGNATTLPWASEEDV